MKLSIDVSKSDLSWLLEQLRKPSESKFAPKGKGRSPSGFCRERQRLTSKVLAKMWRPGRHHDGNGLYLQITPTGVRSWILRYELHHRERFMGLGPYPLVNLAQARSRARKAKRLLVNGIDPIDMKHSDEARKAKLKLVG